MWSKLASKLPMFIDVEYVRLLGELAHIPDVLMRAFIEEKDEAQLSDDKWYLTRDVLTFIDERVGK
jgi:hypothetical protein